MEDEQEFGFWHLLVRDVCYAQIPRVARAARHRAAAAWVERQAGGRVEDLADVLAHHFLTALELAHASGQTEQAQELQAGAIRYLTLAGERAIGLDVGHAEASLARALALAPSGHPARALLLERWAQAAQQQGQLLEAKAALEEAHALYLERGDTIGAGRALSVLVTVLWALGDPRRKEVIAEALDLLEQQPAGPELVAAYAQLAGVHFISGLYENAIAAAQRAVGLASELGLPEPARAVGFLGASRSFLGDRQGIENLRRALELSIEQSLSREAAVIYGNYAVAAHQYDGPEAGLALCRDGTEFSERRGIAELALINSIESLRYLVECGRSDGVAEQAAALAERAEAAGGVVVAITARSLEFKLLFERGESSRSTDVEKLADSVRGTGVPETIIVGFTGAAQRLLGTGRPEEAKALLSEVDRFRETRADPYYASYLGELVRCALALGDVELATRLVDGAEPLTPLFAHALLASRALLAEAAGNHAEAAPLYAEAVERWRGFGNVPERAYALLGRGRCLAALGSAEAELLLREARDAFAPLGYRRALNETEQHLAAALTASS